MFISKRWVACLLAAVVCILWCMPAVCNAEALDNHVVITGKLDHNRAGKLAQLLILNENVDPNDIKSREIEYQETFEIGADGSYSYEFDYGASLEGCKFLLTQGGESIHQSVTRAAVVNGGTQVQQGETFYLEGSDLEVLASDLEALYRSVNVKDKLIITVYDTKDKLIDIIVSNSKTNSEDSGINLLSLPPESTRLIVHIVNPKETPVEFFELKPVEKKAIKVLAIGNSFSDNAVTFLPNFAEADDFDLTVANLYIGGCSLKTHWEKASSDAADYAYKKTGQDNKKSTMKEALLDEQWDYITFQQASNFSPDWSTYEPYLSQLSAYVKQFAPQAQQIIHQTWAYKDTCSRLTGELGYQTPDEMFTDLKDAYQKAADTLGTKILPSGQAFSYALKERPNLILYAGDGYHAGPMGCYTAGAVWYEALTGRQILLNTYCPASFSIDEMYTLKDSAHKVVREYGWNQ